MLQSGLLKVIDASSDEGLGEIEQVLDAARMRSDQDQTLAALLSLGDANWILDRIETASAYYERALALLNQRPQASVEAAVRVRLAALSSAAGRPQSGIESGRRAVTLFQSLGDVSGEAASWALLASLHEALGHGAEGDEASQKSLAMYRQRTLLVHAVRPSPIGPKEFR